MKTKSSNSHKDSKKVYHPVNHERSKGINRLQGRNSSDGRERSYENDTEESESVKKTGRNKNISENEITGKVNQEDIKKEFEISSEKKSGKDSGTDRKKRVPGAESEEQKLNEKENGSDMNRKREPVAESDEQNVNEKEDGSGMNRRKTKREPVADINEEETSEEAARKKREKEPVTESDEKESGSDMNRRKKEKEPVAESEEETSEEEEERRKREKEPIAKSEDDKDSKEKGSLWRKSYKGDAEVVI